MRARSCFALVLGLLLAGPAAAQSAADPAEREVLAVIQELFDGMRARDTARMRATLHPGARLVSAGMRQGAPDVRVDAIDGWLAGIAGAAPGAVLDERLRNTVVRVDGGLASVWTEYLFYVGERLNHCGVDALHLVRTAAGWKIIDLADTRRREGCTP
jgi:hypothetical protein